MTDTIIVMPCYNEARRLNPAPLRDFLIRQSRCALLMADDGSSDQTLQVLETLREQIPGQVGVHRLEEHRGKAEAVRQGILRAFDLGPRLIAYWDADLATPLETIPQYIAVMDRLQEVQMVIGCRIPLLGHAIQRRPLRRWMGRVFSRTASSVLGVPVYDTQCGAKIFRATDFTRALFAEPFRSAWIFDVEILARMRVALGRQDMSRRIYEFPLESWHEVPGSKLKARDFLKATWELAAIYWTCLRPRGLTVKDRPLPR